MKNLQTYLNHLKSHYQSLHQNNLNKAFSGDLNHTIKTALSHMKATSTQAFDALAHQAFELSCKARKRILNTQNPKIYTKKDNSKLTDADLAAHNTLLALPHFKVVSEENITEFFCDDKLCLPEVFWLIDPLDGTSGYISRRRDYCICIALVCLGRPIFGLVYDVVADFCLYSSISSPLYMYHHGTLSAHDSVFSAGIKPTTQYTKSPTLRQLIYLLPNHSKSSEYTARGLSYSVQSSAIKFLHLALGKADCHFRDENLGAWDLCAGDFLLLASGGAMICADGYMRYDRVKMPTFGAFAPSFANFSY